MTRQIEDFLFAGTEDATDRGGSDFLGTDDATDRRFPFRGNRGKAEEVNLDIWNQSMLQG